MKLKSLLMHYNEALVLVLSSLLGEWVTRSYAYSWIQEAHSFIDQNVAHNLKCDLVPISPMGISVAGGEKLRCDQMCPKVEWDIQGHKFAFPVRMLKLGGYHMVLGVDWLAKLSPVEFDFKEKRLGSMRTRSSTLMPLLMLMSVI